MLQDNNYIEKLLKILFFWAVEGKEYGYPVMCDTNVRDQLKIIVIMKDKI